MNRTRKKSKIVYIGIFMLLLFFLAAVGHSCGRKLAVSDYEDNVNRIKEIDTSRQQEEVNALVEEGRMNVNYSSHALFQGKISEKFNVKNIKNNHYPIVFELMDEKGTCLYTSKKIEPGYEINHIELKKELSKGTHECRLKVGYAEEGNVSSAFPITIEVK